MFKKLGYLKPNQLIQSSHPHHQLIITPFSIGFDIRIRLSSQSWLNNSNWNSSKIHKESRTPIQISTEALWLLRSLQIKLLLSVAWLLLKKCPRIAKNLREPKAFTSSSTKHQTVVKIVNHWLSCYLIEKRDDWQNKTVHYREHWNAPSNGC